MKEKVNQIKGQYTEAAMAGGVSQSLGSQMNPFMSIRELTVSGLLAGITIFLGLTGYGFIPLIFMNATILHIPTIIGSVVAGPRIPLRGIFFYPDAPCTKPFNAVYSPVQCSL
mgnify:CR=1 FL=1